MQDKIAIRLIFRALTQFGGISKPVIVLVRKLVLGLLIPSRTVFLSVPRVLCG